MTKRKTYSRSEYKNNPNHAFINLTGGEAQDGDFKHYKARFGKHVHIANGEDAAGEERYILVDSLLAVAKTAKFSVVSAPRLKKVEASFGLGDNACTIGISAAGDRVFLCEGKTGSFFALIP